MWTDNLTTAWWTVAQHVLVAVCSSLLCKRDPSYVPRSRSGCPRVPSEPEFKSVRIHVFGHNAIWKGRHASMLTIHDFGPALLADVRNSPVLRRNDTPIVLICHRMGGLVIKTTLLLAKEDHDASDIATRIHTVFSLLLTEGRIGKHFQQLPQTRGRIWMKGLILK